MALFLQMWRLTCPGPAMATDFCDSPLGLARGSVHWAQFAELGQHKLTGAREKQTEALLSTAWPHHQESTSLGTASGPGIVVQWKELNVGIKQSWV